MGRRVLGYLTVTACRTTSGKATLRRAGVDRLPAPGHEVVEFDGPVLELPTETRTRFDRRMTARP